MGFWAENFTQGDSKRLDFSRIAYAAVTYFLVMFLFTMAGLFGIVLFQWAIGIKTLMSVADMKTMGTITAGAMAWAQGIYIWRRNGKTEAKQ